jgi:hypothetical protein
VAINEEAQTTEDEPRNQKGFHEQLGKKHGMPMQPQLGRDGVMPTDPIAKKPMDIDGDMRYDTALFDESDSIVTDRDSE